MKTKLRKFGAWLLAAALAFAGAGAYGADQTLTVNGAWAGTAEGTAVEGGGVFGTTAFAKIQDAVNAADASAGLVTIIVKAGTYGSGAAFYSGINPLPNLKFNDGTQDWYGRIHLIADGEVVVNGRFDFTGDDTIQYVTDIQVTGFTFAGQAYPIYIMNSVGVAKDIVITNNKITGATQAIYVNSGFATDITVTGNSCDASSRGVSIGGAQGRIDKVLLSNNVFGRLIGIYGAVGENGVIVSGNTFNCSGYAQWINNSNAAAYAVPITYTDNVFASTVTYVIGFTGKVGKSDFAIGAGNTYGGEAITGWAEVVNDKFLVSKNADEGLAQYYDKLLYLGDETAFSTIQAACAAAPDNGTLVLMDGATPVEVSKAEANRWCYFAAESYSTPIADKVVTISTAAELALFAKDVTEKRNAYNGHTVNITADIDLSAHEWVSIKALDERSPYWDALQNVTIDGKGHAIKGLTVTQSGVSEQGFIGVSAGKITIKNLTFDQANVTTGSRSGIVIGTCYNAITLEGVTVTNSTLAGTWYVAAHIGFTGGNGVQSVVKNCKCAGLAVTATEDGDDSGVGAMVGLVNEGDSLAFTGNVLKSDCTCNGDAPWFVRTSLNPSFAAIPSVACTGDWCYSTIAAAMAEAGELSKTAEGTVVVQLYPLTIEEGAVKLPEYLRNVKLVGAADKATTIRNGKIMASDGGPWHYENVTVEGIVFDNANFVLTGWRTGDACVAKGWTFCGNDFLNVDNAESNAAIHFNTGSNEPVTDLTVISNRIDGVKGSSNSGICLVSAGGRFVVRSNVIANCAWRAMNVGFVTADGIAEEIVIEDNALLDNVNSGIQLYPNEDEQVDPATISFRYNVVDECYEKLKVVVNGFDLGKTTLALDHNYFNRKPADSPDRFYVNGYGTADTIYTFGVYPYYDAYHRDELLAGTMTAHESLYNLVQPGAVIVKVDGKMPVYSALADAVAAAETGDRVRMLVASGEEVVLNAGVTLDPNGFPHGEVRAANGSILKANEDGTFTAQLVVARIGDQKFASLEEAIAAVPEGLETPTTITMVADETITGVLAEGGHNGKTRVIFPANKSVRLDLNGHYISGYDHGNVGVFAFMTVFGNLIVDDTSDEADGGIYDEPPNPGDYLVKSTINVVDGSLTVLNGEIATSGYDNESTCVAIEIGAWHKGGHCVIEGGYVWADGTAVRVHPNFGDDGTYELAKQHPLSLKMTGGIVDGWYAVVFQNGSDVGSYKSTVDITGGTISYYFDGVRLFQCRPGDVTVNVSGDVMVDTWNSNPYAAGGALHVTTLARTAKCDPTAKNVVNIKGGTWFGGPHFANVADPHDAVEVYISGGQFSGDAIGRTGAPVLSGGVYATEPTAADYAKYAAEGCIFVPNTDAATKAAYPWTIGPQQLQPKTDGVDADAKQEEKEAIPAEKQDEIPAAVETVKTDVAQAATSKQVTQFTGTGLSEAVVKPDGSLDPLVINALKAAAATDAEKQKIEQLSSDSNSTKRIQIELKKVDVGLSVAGDAVVGSANEVSYDVVPRVKTVIEVRNEQGEVTDTIESDAKVPNETIANSPITFRLGVTWNEGEKVKVLRDEQNFGIATVKAGTDGNYVELTSNHFSEFKLLRVNVPTVCKVGDLEFETIDAAIAASDDAYDTTIEMLADVDGEVTVTGLGKRVIDTNGTSFEAVITPDGDLEVVKGSGGMRYLAAPKVEVPTGPSTVMPIRGYVFPTDVATDVQKTNHLAQVNADTGNKVWQDYALFGSEGARVKLTPEIVKAAAGSSVVTIKAAGDYVLASPTRCGVKVSFQLQKREGTTGNFAAYGAPSATPEFTVDVSETETERKIGPKTFWKIQTIFSCEEER